MGSLCHGVGAGPVSYTHLDVYKRQPYAFNLFSHNTRIDADTGYNEEETKVIEETRKIFADPAFRITATCVRVPVLRAHCVALNFECDAPITAGSVREILAAAPGVKIIDDLSLIHI